MTDIRFSDGEVATIRSLSNSSTHADGSITSLEHDAPAETGLDIWKTGEEPREPTPEIFSDMQQLTEVPPQSFLSLDEYLILSEDVIVPNIKAFERIIIRNFIDGMKNQKQRCSLIEKLNQNGWTWKVTQQEIMAISNAARKQETEGKVREAKKNAKHETQRTQPTRSSQRKKRKINYRS